jgi:hypothetical protein
MHDLYKELTEETDETQMDLEAVKMYIDIWTRSLKSDITDTKCFHKDIENTRYDLHQELDILFQVKAWTVKAEIGSSKREWKPGLRPTNASSKQVEAGAEHEPGTGTSAVKSLKFDGTTSWAVFWWQFETAAEHNSWMSQEKCTYLIMAMQSPPTTVLCGALLQRPVPCHRPLLTPVIMYRVFGAQADWTLTHTSHKDTEQTTREASITLDGVTLTDSLIR